MHIAQHQEEENTSSTVALHLLLSRPFGSGLLQINLVLLIVLFIIVSLVTKLIVIWYLAEEVINRVGENVIRDQDANLSISFPVNGRPPNFKNKPSFKKRNSHQRGPRRVQSS